MSIGISSIGGAYNHEASSEPDGTVAAACESLSVPGRKVRTPKGSVLGNAQARKRDG